MRIEPQHIIREVPTRKKYTSGPLTAACWRRGAAAIRTKDVWRRKN